MWYLAFKKFFDFLQRRFSNTAALWMTVAIPTGVLLNTVKTKYWLTCFDIKTDLIQTLVLASPKEEAFKLSKYLLSTLTLSSIGVGAYHGLATYNVTVALADVQKQAELLAIHNGLLLRYGSLSQAWANYAMQAQICNELGLLTSNDFKYQAISNSIKATVELTAEISRITGDSSLLYGRSDLSKGLESLKAHDEAKRLMEEQANTRRTWLLKLK